MESSHTPYFRHSLAKTLYNRMLNDQSLRSMDTSKWYRCNLNQVEPPDLREKFIQLNYDSETSAFIENCFTKSDWIFLQVYHVIAKAFLSFFMTQTSINGWLNRGSMFVFSQEQFLSLLDVPLNWKSGTLLDLGAGDGNVTQVMAPFFSHTYVTEISSIMAEKLSKRGFEVLDVNHWEEAQPYFDVISCLNLVDRCDTPLSLLKQLRSKLTPGSGRLILALVLPCNQYVETGGKFRHDPSERLDVHGPTFEDQLNSLYQNVLAPLGYSVERWTRLPYLCEGDLNQSFFWLDDVVLVLKPIDLPDDGYCNVLNTTSKSCHSS